MASSTTKTQSEQVKSPTLTQQERFFRYFQHEITALQEQMDRLPETPVHGGERNDAVDHCLAGIARLSHEVKDASSYVPAYDQRTYAEAIKALSEKLQNIRSNFAPRPKFSFRTKTAPQPTLQKNPSAISLSDAAELAAQQRLSIPTANDSLSSTAASSVVASNGASPTEEKPQPDFTADEIRNGDVIAGPKIRKPSFSSSDRITISHQKDIHIVLPAAASRATSSGVLSNLDRCVVDMSHPTDVKPFTSLTLKNIKSSLIICGQVAGPAHITGVENSVVVVGCRQFRMHDCRDVDVYLFVGSRPIIEDCEEVKFAPLPERYQNQNTGSTTQNQWDQVDDFKWLKSETNPHWRRLASSEQIKDGTWEKIVPGGPELGTERILNAVSIV